MVQGSWLMTHGSWLMAHGSWRMAMRSWAMVHGSWLIAHGSGLFARGSWLMAHGAWLVAHSGSGLMAHGQEKSVALVPVWAPPRSGAPGTRSFLGHEPRALTNHQPFNHQPSTINHQAHTFNDVLFAMLVFRDKFKSIIS